MTSYTRTVNFSLPRNPNAPLIFTPLDSVLINDAGEIVTKAARSATTDGQGAGSIVLDTPDDSGRRAWVWQVELPDGETPQFALTWGAGAAPLAALLAADASRLTPNVLASLLASLYSLNNAEDAAWVAAGSAGGALAELAYIDDADSDGTQYARKDGGWEAIEAADVSALLPKTAGSGQALTGILYLDPGADDTAQIFRIPATSRMLRIL